MCKKCLYPQFCEKENRYISKKEILSRQESVGLGDTVEKIFKKTGIKKLAEVIKKKECGGCGRRKKWLNEKFPYNKEGDSG